MGKAGKWFRSLLASVKSPEKDRKSSNKRSLLTSGTPYVDGIDANKHAIAVAAATAAVSEAALAASKAAAEVVRLAGGGRAASGDRRATVAAVKIQSAFRAYLAKRALRALKGLVKLQALVRGHIVRKQSADMLRRMQAMARIQARASAHRSYAKTIFSNSHHPVRGITSPRIYDERSNSVVNGGSLLKPRHLRSGSDISSSKENSEIASRWLNQWMEQCAWDKSLHKTSLDEQSDKILEIDTWKPHPNNKTRNDQTAPVSRPSSKHHKPNPSISSEDIDRVPTRMAHNSPRVHSSFTPTTSECSRSGFGDYIGGCHRSYMTNTESSRAKVRSYSAPKQRMQLEGLGQSVNFGFWEYSDTFSERGSFIPANIRDGTYRYSGQVKRQGTPARDPGVGISSVYGHRMNV